MDFFSCLVTKTDRWIRTLAGTDLGGTLIVAQSISASLTAMGSQIVIPPRLAIRIQRLGRTSYHPLFYQRRCLAWASAIGCVLRGKRVTAIVNKTSISFHLNQCVSTARDPRRCWSIAGGLAKVKGWAKIRGVWAKIGWVWAKIEKVAKSAFLWAKPQRCNFVGQRKFIDMQ